MRLHPLALLGLVPAAALTAVVAPAPPGGDLTIAADPATAYSQPAPGLDAAQAGLFANGREEFHQHWVVLPVIGGKWGRGPTSNAEECIGCHVGNGRGRPPEHADESPVSMTVHLSMPGEDEHGGPLAHPAYGHQLQSQGELGKVPPEGEASVAWMEHEELLADGTRVYLRRPRLDFRQLRFGPLDGALTSIRVAQPLIGMGLLDAVPESLLLEIARSQQALGFNGRPNYVWDVERQAMAPGRFGWKATQPTLRQQVAAAYLADMGVTTLLHPVENCPTIQVACRKRPGGTVPEQSPRAFDEIVFYLQGLGVPARRGAQDPHVLRGEQLFVEAQCSVCHVPELRAGDYPGFARIAGQAFRPYTDLLLHDMGEELADGRPDFRAGGRDWRTAPLWGLGLSKSVNGNAMLLHDGRARTLAEAILWHGGEARGAREAFRNMPRADREALFAFLESI